MTQATPVGSESAALANEDLMPARAVKTADRALLSDERPVRIKLTLSKGEVMIEGPRQEPRWLYPSLNALQRVSRLPDDWDSYGGRPIADLAVMGALKALFQVLAHQSRELPAPAVVPTSEGGVQLEWHRGEGDIEIRVSPSGKYSVFLRDPRTQEGIDIEPVGRADFHRVGETIATLWS